MKLCLLRLEEKKKIYHEHPNYQFMIDWNIDFSIIKWSNTYFFICIDLIFFNLWIYSHLVKSSVRNFSIIITIIDEGLFRFFHQN